ncbi:MAG: transcription antitermination factor NusB [Novosphingobium sp.]|uniref:transcription antitermination factor NusB n=1 Tax=Novosphingobium sp. TaxID=1874826 RepID=UPI0032BAA68E
MTKNARSKSRTAARLAAVQALYQYAMEGTALPRLLDEFHRHRLGAEIEGDQYLAAEQDFFDGIVEGVIARYEEIDELLAARLSETWSIERLDRTMLQILRAGVWELLARADVPTPSIISEYVDVAHAFFEKREAKFANAVLDAVAKEVR